MKTPISSSRVSQTSSAQSSPGPYSPLEYSPSKSDFIEVVAKKRREPDSFQIDYALNYQKMKGRQRIFEKRLVYMTGFGFGSDEQVSMEMMQVLKGDACFGKYGKVKSMVINSNQSIPEYYVYFENAHDSTLAVMALMLANPSLVITYGATKYCEKYVKGVPCYHQNCQFQHSERTQDEIRGVFNKNGLRARLTKQTHKASKIIKDNLILYLQKEYAEFIKSKAKTRSKAVNINKENQSDIELTIEFPSIKETLSQMIYQGLILRSEYLTAKEEVKTKNRQIKENTHKQKLKAQRIDKQNMQFPSISTIEDARDAVMPLNESSKLNQPSPNSKETPTKCSNKQNDIHYVIANKILQVAHQTLYCRSRFDFIQKEDWNTVVKESKKWKAIVKVGLCK